MGWLQSFFSESQFCPHGGCYNWDPYVIWLHVISDAVIALSYYSIPLTLVYFVSKRKDLAFDWMFVCFAVFIVACGTTHLMEILNVWHPYYWVAGALKAITALASIITAILLIRLLPQALALPSPEQLRKSNDALQHEVTERQQASRKIEALNQELIAHSAKIQTTNKELETFAYSVSHDLRAPLRHIDGYVNLLREKGDTLGVEGDRYTKKISDSARQMGLLIDNLLAFSGMGRAAMQREWINSEAIVGQVQDELTIDNPKRTIKWEIGPLPRVYADRALFKQIWINLLSNAVKYTRNRPTSEIKITCKEFAQEFEFSVKDDGAGFNMEYASKLFGIFQRLHLKEEFEGTGIGLANVRRIVERHGGRTWAEGRVDQGATFYFTLPKSE